MSDKKKGPKATDRGDDEYERSLRTRPEQFLDLKPPEIPHFLDNVVLAFAKSIPEDARPQCVLTATDQPFPEDGEHGQQRRFLLAFVRERLMMISNREYGLWLNGRLPFVTPRELLLWRLRQYVEYVWAFQLPDNEDLAMIFNTTKLRATNLASDFIARFRKALLFPIALRRLYRILRQEDKNYPMVDEDLNHRNAYGATFLVPSRRYAQDANSLVDEFRLRGGEFLRDAAIVSQDENLLWVQHTALRFAESDEIRNELFLLYKIPRDEGYEG